MPPQPRLNVGTRCDHPQALRPRVRQRGADQGVSHTATLPGTGHLGMLEIQDVVGERRVEKLGVTVLEVDEEPGALRIVLNRHTGSGERSPEDNGGAPVGARHDFEYTLPAAGLPSYTPPT